MSNKIVPQIYRVVIDDVIRSIKPEFDEYGVSEDVLAELQHKWESKVIASHVAEFEPPPPQPVPPHHPTHPSVAPQQHNPQQHPAYPPHPIHHGHPQYYYTPQPPPPPPPGPQVKTEPVDSRYMLNAPSQTSSYTLPSLPGPPISGPGVPPRPGGQVMTFQGTPPTARYPGNAQSIAPQKNGATNGRIPQTDGPSASSSIASSSRIPQIDGPSSSSSSGSPSPPPAAYAPRGTAHPSLPQPSQTRTDDGEGDEAINSDLDDSDSDNEKEDVEGTGGEIDIVFCTYDKVARVKNKWKCVLKDGMIHVNGKDYLFAKCTGEFEW